MIYFRYPPQFMKYRKCFWVKSVFCLFGLDKYCWNTIRIIVHEGFDKAHLCVMTQSTITTTLPVHFAEERGQVRQNQENCVLSNTGWCHFSFYFPFLNLGKMTHS